MAIEDNVANREVRENPYLGQDDENDKQIDEAQTQDLDQVSDQAALKEATT